LAQDEIFERVKKIIIDQLGVEGPLVTMEASFIDDLGADSLEIVDLIMAFEGEFGITIPDEDAEDLSTVRDAVEYLRQSTKES
jgi:acyl carrier protein